MLLLSDLPYSLHPDLNAGFLRKESLSVNFPSSLDKRAQLSTDYFVGHGFLFVYIHKLHLFPTSTSPSLLSISSTFTLLEATNTDSSIFMKSEVFFSNLNIWPDH